MIPVIGAMWALVGTTDLANTQDVQRRGIEGANEKPFRPERFDQNGLTSSCQICYWKIASDLNMGNIK